MPQVLIYLPVLKIDSGVRKINFKKFPEGDMVGFLPVSNLPLPDDEEQKHIVSEAWQEILDKLNMFQMYLNYHRCDKRLVIARLTRKTSSPVRGRKLAEFYIDTESDVQDLVLLLNGLSKGESSLKGNGKEKAIAFKLPYEYNIQ